MTELRRIYSRLRGMITRSVVTSIDPTSKNPAVTVEDKVSTERIVELLEPYGITTVPASEDGPEMIVLSLSGSGDHLIGLPISGGSGRPTDGLPGDVIIYHRTDKEQRQRIHLMKDGEIRATSDTSTVTLTPSDFTAEVAGNSISLNSDRILFSVNGNEFKIDGSKTETNKDVVGDGISLKDHVHIKVKTGTDKSGKPE